MPVTEKQLIGPSVAIMGLPEFRNQGISISELMPRIRDFMQPLGHDLEIINGRRDDYFSQKVRNLVCHRTLEKYGLAEFVSGARPGRYFLTDDGRQIIDLARQTGRRPEQVVYSEIDNNLNRSTNLSLPI